MSTKLKKPMKLGVSLLLAITLIYMAFKGINWADFWENLKCTRWGFIVFFLLCALATIWIRALRWKVMLKPLDANIGTWTTWHANNIGNLTNAILSGSGELVRCAFACRGGANYDAVLGTEIMERAWDALAIILLAFIAILSGSDAIGEFFTQHIVAPVTSSSTALIWAGCGIAALVLIICLCFRFRRANKVCGAVANFLGGVGQGFISFRKIRNKGAFLALSALLWIFYILMYHFILQAVPALSGLNVYDALLLAAVGNLASVIPVPGGVGAYHYLISLCLSAIYGIDWNIGILFATLQHELHAVLLIVLGIMSCVKTNLKFHSYDVLS